MNSGVVSKARGGSISVADDFSTVPAGRFRSDGPFSGEQFREDVLRPALELHDKVVVHLDGTEGYGSSFLEEAFGGLVRERFYSHKELKSKLKVVSSDPAYVDEIWSYISEAEANQH